MTEMKDFPTAVIASLSSAVVKIHKGNGETAMSPLEGIPEGKPTIILQKSA